jgi:hypothetical protein
MPSSTGVGQAPPTSPRAGLPLPGTGAQPQAPTRLQQQTWTATSDQARSRQQEIERRAREQGRQMREQQARLAEEREAAQRAATERERARREARETQQQRQSEQQQRQTAQRQAAAALAVGGPVVASQLRNRLGQPGALREVLVLKEILDPPLSLRDPNHLSAG